ncbi:MAG: SDR family oxidoreductase [Gammaproteobacteria bacterium]|nr:SDR family oxidoreductase [Gammaproteobacteria bacterium]
MHHFDLSGKAAIVTGGNGGIGRGIALALAEAGAAVCIAGRNQQKNETVRTEIEHLGGRCITVNCDVNNPGDVDTTIAATEKAFGGLDILVNNAGIAGLEPPEATTDEAWSQVIGTNLDSVFRFSRAAYPRLCARGGGKIINIGSEYSIFGSPFAVSYAASKGAVIQLTKSLAIAWAAHGIQVNAIIPGWIATDMTAVVKEMGEVYQQILERTPARRFGEPEECGGAAVFLASAASNFVTGHSLIVDGGYSVN